MIIGFCLAQMEPPKEIDESDLDAKYGGKTLPAFDPAEVAKVRLVNDMKRVL